MNFRELSKGKIVAGAFLLLMAAFLSANADTVDVDITGSFIFSPATLTIHAGQAVRWINNAIENHTSTSTSHPQVWNSETLAQGQSFVHIFNTVGTFPYECSIHPSMSGEIIVQPALDVSDLHSTHLPNNYQLQQNHPNPFNPETAIEYSLATNSHVTITVYNILGQEISRLVDKAMAPGNYVADWDGRGANGIPVGSGIYFYRMDAGDFRETRRMILLR